MIGINHVFEDLRQSFIITTWLEQTDRIVVSHVGPTAYAIYQFGVWFGKN